MVNIQNYGDRQIEEIDSIYLTNTSGSFLMHIDGSETTSEDINKSENLKEINNYIPFKGGFFGQLVLSRQLIDTLEMNPAKISGKIYLYIIGKPIAIDAFWLNPGCSWDLIKSDNKPTAAVKPETMTKNYILRLFIPEVISLSEEIQIPPFEFDTLNARIQGALIDAKIY